MNAPAAGRAEYAVERGQFGGIGVCRADAVGFDKGDAAWGEIGLRQYAEEQAGLCFGIALHEIAACVGGGGDEFQAGFLRWRTGGQ